MTGGPWKDKSFDAGAWQPPKPIRSEEEVGLVHRETRGLVILATIVLMLLALAVFAGWTGAAEPRVPYEKSNLWCAYFHEEVVPESFPWALGPDADRISSLGRDGSESDVWRSYLWAENMLCGKGLYGLYIPGRLGRQ